MIVIGITGGMASGKSTIARMIARPGIPHIDADHLVHRLFQTDRRVIAEIEACFPGTTGPQGVDRAALGAALAADESRLAWLEGLLHPRVRALEEAAIVEARAQGCRALLLDIPLLFETDAHALCDVVIIAHAPEKQRIARAIARGMKPETVSRLLARQLKDEERLAHDAIVIATHTDLNETRQEVEALLGTLGLA